MKGSIHINDVTVQIEDYLKSLGFEVTNDGSNINFNKESLKNRSSVISVAIELNHYDPEENLTPAEEEMLEIGCPQCHGEIELYDTNNEGNGGRYRCLECGRDTVWKQGKALNIHEVLNQIERVR